MARYFRAATAAVGLFASVPAGAQVPVRCSAFLHNHDGSWTSFVNATFLATRGPVPVRTGERISERGSPAQVDLARLLTRLCENDRD